MKKITAVFVILTLIFCFASCGKTKQYEKIGETPTLADRTPSTEGISEEVTEKTQEESTSEDLKQDEFATPITTKRPSTPSTTRPSTSRPASSATSATEPSTEKVSEVVPSEMPTTAIRPTETTTLEKLDETTEGNLPESRSEENAE